MIIKLRYLLLFLCIGPWAQAQVKIGDNPQDLDPASILELESTSRALVISRVTTAQMNAIVPLRGAMVYNTDADCLYYYNGTNWINLCEASGGPFTFTTDPVVNPISTITITRTGNNYNFEVGEITSNNIVDGSINGFSDIQDGTISSSKLQDRAVGPSKLEEGAVSSFEIENESILTVDIAPEGPDQILATNSNGEVQWQNKGSLAAITDQATITGAGTASDRLKVSDDIMTAIANNTTGIATHIAADEDTDSTNELQTLAQILAQGTAANGRITNLTNPAAPQDAATKAYVDNVVGGAAQTVVSGNTGNLITIGTDSGALLTTVNDADSDATNELITAAVLTGTTLTITEAGVNHDVNLSGLGGGSGSADGSETKINPSATVTVAGMGTTLDPYVLTSLGGADGSETIIDPTTSTVGVTGSGTVLDPYVLAATAGDGSETIIDATNSTVGVTGSGTVLDPYVLAATAGDGSETIIDATNSTVGVTGTGTTALPYVLTVNGSETIIDATNSTVGVTGTGTTANPYILTAISTIPTGIAGALFYSDGAGGLTYNTGLSWNTTTTAIDITGDVNATGTINAGGDITSGGTSVVTPDYVFETYFKGSSELSKEYRFKTLTEIEAFVKENHHLPGILSAEEVKASGKWNLTQASVKNLEKIEELYLHTIEQQKEIEQLKADKDSLSKEVETIKREMEEIKRVLESRINEQ